MTNNDKLCCPECGGTELARRYASFWVDVDENGDDKAANFSDHQSDTELTDNWCCSDCQYEWGEDCE